MNRVSKLLEMIDRSANDSFLQHALALEYIKIGEDGKARELFETILQREPGYVGSYYHLAKLLERISEPQKAKAVYERGMEEAKNAGDKHSYNELQSALGEMDEE